MIKDKDYLTLFSFPAIRRFMFSRCRYTMYNAPMAQYIIYAIGLWKKNIRIGDRQRAIIDPRET